jgi:hypothetical protein
MLVILFCIKIKMENENIRKGCDDEIVFVKALVAVLLGAVLVNLWIRVINNFTYHTLNLSPDSTFWAIIIALFCTGLLIIYIIFILDEDTSLQIRQNMTGVTYATITGINNNMMNVDTNDNTF